MYAMLYATLPLTAFNCRTAFFYEKRYYY